MEKLFPIPDFIGYFATKTGKIYSLIPRDCRNRFDKNKWCKPKELKYRVTKNNGYIYLECPNYKGYYEPHYRVDFDKSMIFVWRNGVIVGSVVIPINEDIYIYFWINNSEYKSFNNYEEFRKFYNEKYKNHVI